MASQKTLADIQALLRQEMPGLAERFGVASLALFGSFVRAEVRPESDLDILVRFHRTPGLLRFIELENYLSDLLGLPVDLVEAGSLKPHIGRRVLQEAVPI